MVENHRDYKMKQLHFLVAGGGPQRYPCFNPWNP